MMRIGARFAALASFASLVVLAVGVSSPCIAMPRYVLVELFQAKPDVRSVRIDGPVNIVQPIGRAAPGQAFLVKAGGLGVQLFLRPENSASAGNAFITAKKIVLEGTAGTTRIIHSPDVSRTYRGQVVFERGASGILHISNRVSLPDYVTSVVGSETNPDFPLAELQAQAVLAQTLSARYKEGDKLGDTTEKQAYLGVDYERPQIRQAVASVWNRVLTYRGNPITVYFHSTCAGGTSDGARYFDLVPRSGYPYLVGRPCSFCKPSPFWHSKRSVIPNSVYDRKFPNCSLGASSNALMQQSSPSVGHHSEPAAPTVVEVNAEMRPTRIQRAVQKKGRIILETVNAFTYWTEVGQRLGWDKVPGTRFTIGRNSTGGLVFESTGGGHGVGFCQWGASEQARQGKTYRQLLQYYFPGTKVEEYK